jgi:hypothetical protein
VIATCRDCSRPRELTVCDQCEDANRLRLRELEAEVLELRAELEQAAQRVYSLAQQVERGGRP